MRDPSRYFRAETRGHCFEFERTNAGTIRTLAVDGRYNDRADRVLRRLASPPAIAEATEAARLHYWRLSAGRAA